RQGVARVDDQVHQNLLELSGICEDSAEIVGREQRELDVLACKAPEHPLHPEQDLIEVQDLGLEHLPAAEGKELTSEPRPALGGSPELFEGGSNRTPPFPLL